MLCNKYQLWTITKEKIRIMKQQRFDRDFSFILITFDFKIEQLIYWNSSVLIILNLRDTFQTTFHFQSKAKSTPLKKKKRKKKSIQHHESSTNITGPSTYLKDPWLAHVWLIGNESAKVSIEDGSGLPSFAVETRLGPRPVHAGLGVETLRRGFLCAMPQPTDASI